MYATVRFTRMNIFCHCRLISRIFSLFQTSVQHQETEQPVNFFTLIHFVVLLFFLDKELEVVGFDDDMIAAASS